MTDVEQAAAPPRRPLALVAGTAVAVVVLDQLTKWWAERALDGGRTIEIVGSLRLRLTHNTGISFSIASGSTLLVSILATAVLGVVVFLALRARDPWEAAAFGLVVGGALGNLTDRAVRNGGVVDFIDLQWWPVFNVADIAIFCAVALLLIRGFRSDET